ncbi:undecaprenyl-diphosphatase BcrC [Weizmannia acidilactici]|uniref:Undecaprenyl-diphosphatase BcrC n=1 Tax=Weizmannia acidilactici TaxID=2607726 RepID=A0A5J4JGL4_9BACI|nr:undecaprenyl-diphosphatase [Weizmannia acidilactici]GER65897.1 undecaprenyl-diphosphatase BcrC [Weizmannia acidilactici]GER69775.1 undecaprenyl-diphosphatase BcrC [Weizmannia acidilactici]GER73190.1 undecaprenyl-diphosphatase BcrC [Weizmannia acidilactici]
MNENAELFFMIHNLSGHDRLIDQLMIFFTQDALPLFAAVLLLVWLLGNNKMKKMVLYAGITGIAALMINYFITLVYYEPRPFVTYHIRILIPHAADDSFPSDHASGTFAIAFALWMRNRKLGSVMIVCAILTGISRVWVGHHYPLDVAASIVVALVAAYGIHKLEHFFNPAFEKLIQLYHEVLAKFTKKVYK